MIPVTNQVSKEADSVVALLNNSQDDGEEKAPAKEKTENQELEIKTNHL